MNLNINTLMLQSSNELSKQALLADLKINNISFLFSRRGLPWQWPTQSNLVVATILVTYLDKLLISYVCNKISKNNYFLALTNSSFLISC